MHPLRNAFVRCVPSSCAAAQKITPSHSPLIAKAAKLWISALLPSLRPPRIGSVMPNHPPLPFAVSWPTIRMDRPSQVGGSSKSTTSQRSPASAVLIGSDCDLSANSTRSVLPSWFGYPLIPKRKTRGAGNGPIVIEPSLSSEPLHEPHARTAEAFANAWPGYWPSRVNEPSIATPISGRAAVNSRVVRLAT